MAGKDVQQNRDKVGKIGKLMRNKSYKLWRRKSKDSRKFLFPT